MAVSSQASLDPGRSLPLVGRPLPLGLPPVSWRFPSHMFEAFIEHADDYEEGKQPGQQEQLRQRQYLQKQQRLWQQQQYHQEYQKQEFHPDLELQMQQFQRRHGEFYLMKNKQKLEDQQRVQRSIDEQVHRYHQQLARQQFEYLQQRQISREERTRRSEFDAQCERDYQLVQAQPYQDDSEKTESVAAAPPVPAMPASHRTERPIMLHLDGVTTDCSTDDVSLMSLSRHRKDLSMDSGIQGSSCDLADASDTEEVFVEAPDEKKNNEYRETQKKMLTAARLLDNETYNLVEEVYVEEDPKNRFQKEAKRASVKLKAKKLSVAKEPKYKPEEIIITPKEIASSTMTMFPKSRQTPVPAKRSLSSASQSKAPPTRLFLKNNQSKRSSISSAKYMSLDSLDQSPSVLEERCGQQMSTSSLDSIHQSSSLPSAIDDLIDQALDTDESREDLQGVMSDSLEEADLLRETQQVPKVVETKPKPQDNRFVVVAIDFGTTYTGYAFTFIRDPDINIHMMRKWEGGDPGLNNQKIPTTLLLNPDGSFHSFGFSARDFFNDIDPQEAKKWLYFDKFKMALHHDQNVSRACELTAANGKTVAAVKVFGMALKHLKELVLTELSDQAGGEVRAEDVRWVLTVPAIWKQPAKQLMREAAYQAGISDPSHPEGLLIALEPECASICCRKLRLNQLVPERVMEKDKPMTWSSTASIPAMDPGPSDLLLQDSKEGMRYMVVDCGGGTVDITVHELNEHHGTLRELHKASGGPWGSVRVDGEFVKLLDEIFGADFIAQFKLKRPAAFVELMLSFEARKRSASPHKDAPLNVFPPFAFIDYYRKFSGKEVEHAVKKLGRKEISWSSQGMLRLQPSVMRELFGPTIAKILAHIRDVLDAPNVGHIEYLFLVGGFAESQILQNEVRTAFKERVNVIIPQGVSLAILRGAVLFGLNPNLITTRRSKQTYGVGVMKRFDPCLHPREKLIVKDGVEWCADLLDKFVTIEQSVELGETVLRRYTPACATQNRIEIKIYSANDDDVSFITDPGVSRCGTLSLNLVDKEEGGRREIHTRMVFGGTEISASALDVASGQLVQIEVDFLTA